MEISELYGCYRKSSGVITDSRKSRENAMFFGLRGERFDGNSYARAALSDGCSYAVIDDPEVSDGTARYILVEDSLKALQELASWHRKQLEIPVIAITGSNGKTTTKELTTDVLSTQYEVYSTPGNLNNHIGVPLTLLGITESAELAVIEMGANHTGEIGFLCELAKPDYGLVTNVGRAHLEGFGSFEGVKQGKGELYRYLGEHGGLIFSNADNEVLQEMLEDVQAGMAYYGSVEGALCSGEMLSDDPVLHIRLETADRTRMELKTGLVGSYNLENILAAAAIGLHFRISTVNIEAVLQGWISHNNRSQRIDTGRNVLHMDAYNANPTSMMAALENFSRQEHSRKVLILGDMLELGNDAPAHHAEVVRFATGMSCDEVYLVGPEFSSLPDIPGDFRIFADAGELDAWLDHHPIAGSLVLLKASRGIGLERLENKL